MTLFDWAEIQQAKRDLRLCPSILRGLKERFRKRLIQAVARALEGEC